MDEHKEELGVRNTMSKEELDFRNAMKTELESITGTSAVVEAEGACDPPVVSDVAKMHGILNEWKQKEEMARRKRRIERRSQHIKARLDETKAVAKNCGISVDTLLMIELKDALYATLSTEKDNFLQKVDYDADDWDDWNWDSRDRF